MAAEDDEDPWGFAAKRAERVRGGRISQEPAAAKSSQSGSLADEASPVDTPPDPSAPDRGDDTPPSSDAASVTPTRGTRARGELRSSMPRTSLRERAWPMALSLALVFLAGLLAEVVAAAQTLSLAGPTAMLLVFPLGGVGLIALALLQYRFVDAKARLPVLRGATLGYAAVILVTLVMLLASVAPSFAAIVTWIMADQLNFLLPLLIWSLAADEFNVAEGRKIFGWIVVWSYVGQVAGLAIATAAAPILGAAGVPLPWLLALVPLLLAFVGIWLPQKMRDSAAATGLARGENLPTAIKSAWEFVAGVPVWREMLIGSVLVFVAGMSVFIGFLADSERLLTADAEKLQFLYGGVSLVAFTICWAIQVFFAERLLEKWGIPGVLLVLPFAVIAAGVLLAAGSALQWLPLVAVALVAWQIPRWSIDENARRAALALVPDERRTRVSFIVDLGPVALGLILAGPVAAVGIFTGQYWTVGVIAAVLGALSLPWLFKVRSGWEDSLLNWRLRRRKKSRGLDLGE